VLGIKATLIDGAYHDVDSSVLAFEIAGRAATREGLRKCKSRLKEPIMKVNNLSCLHVLRKTHKLSQYGISNEHKNIKPFSVLLLF
jgi:hypothetical protein